MNNLTLLQYFEWYLPSNQLLWQRAVREAKDIHKMGFNAVWLPPAFKGQDKDNVGYGVYDLYDLGEFKQKGSIATKYGTRREYQAAIKAFQRYGIKVFADIVLNNRIGGDETEVVRAIEQEWDNRLQQVGDIYEIVVQGHPHALCISIDILGRLADSIVSGHLCPGCAENIVDIQSSCQSSLQETLLQSGIHLEVAAPMHERPMVAAGVTDLQQCFRRLSKDEPGFQVETEFRLVQFLRRTILLGIEHLLIIVQRGRWLPESQLW